MTMCNRHWLASLIALSITSTANCQEVSETVLAANAFVRLGAKTVRIDGGRLAYIDLRGSTYTDANAKLFSQTPDLTYLSLNGCPAGDKTLAALSNTKLEWLILDGTKVTEAGLKHLSGLPLRALSLGETDVTDGGVASTLWPTTLRRLDLANTKVSAEGIAQLGKLPSLADLDIAGIAVEKETFAALSSCKCLERLRVTGANLSMSNVSGLKQLTSLKTIELTGPAAAEDVRIRLVTLLPKVNVVVEQRNGRDDPAPEADRHTEPLQTDLNI